MRLTNACRICTIISNEGSGPVQCNKPVKHGTICSMHYLRQWRYGSYEPRPKPPSKTHRVSTKIRDSVWEYLSLHGHQKYIVMAMELEVSMTTLWRAIKILEEMGAVRRPGKGRGKCRVLIAYKEHNCGRDDNL